MRSPSMRAASDGMVPTLLERFDPALAKRIATGATLGVIVVLDLILGGWYFAALLIVAALIMADEWAELARAPRDRAVRFVRVAAAAGPIVAIALATRGQAMAGLAALLVGSAITAGLAATIERAPVDRAAFGVLYIGLPCLCLAWLRQAEGTGFTLVLWLLLTVWATDITAYFAGRGIGGPKLAPKISPSKTWAGLAGGMAGAFLVGLVFVLPGYPWWLSAGIAGMLAIVAQIGDFFESWLKRRAGVKDSGRLLPGHGGLLDRVDGLMTAAPVLAIIIALGQS
jgi:phosphatidate cytidylyltransferase